jgi:hypothetical protein
MKPDPKVQKDAVGDIAVCGILLLRHFCFSRGLDEGRKVAALKETPRKNCGFERDPARKCYANERQF